jgi:hypothetical protein
MVNESAINWPCDSVRDDWRNGIYSQGVTEPWIQQIVAASAPCGAGTRLVPRPHDGMDRQRLGAHRGRSPLDDRHRG